MAEQTFEKQPPPEKETGGTSPMPERQSDILEQATNPSLLPAAEKTHIKNPKRVAAGKLVAVKTRQAREAKKKKMLQLRPQS